MTTTSSTTGEGGVSIEVVGNTVQLAGPYCQAVVEGCKRLGGRWRSAQSVWEVPVVYVAELRALCQRVYGTDGTMVPDTVTLRVRVGDRVAHARAAWEQAKATSSPPDPRSWYELPQAVQEQYLSHEPPAIDVMGDSFELLGRWLLRRFQRDGAVQHAELVALVEGRPWSGAGGSRKNPALDIVEYRVIEVLGVGRQYAQEHVDMYGGAVWIVAPPAPLTEADRYVLEVEQYKLRDQRAELDRRLAEIAQALGQTPDR